MTISKTSNWSKLKKKIVVEKSSKRQKPSSESHSELKDSRSGNQEKPLSTTEKERTTWEAVNEWLANQTKRMKHNDKEKYVALDCEMVGVGSNGRQSVLARCSLVDFDGNEIFDTFVKPNDFVTDFRTQYSGVRKKDLRMGKAITLYDVRLSFICSRGTLRNQFMDWNNSLLYPYN